MDLFDELNKVLLDIQNFQEFIAQKKAADPQFLQRTFWHQGKQSTVLNYLILAHDLEKNNLTNHIAHILHEGADISSNQPIHWALEHKKIDLLDLLFRAIDALSASIGYKRKPRIVDSHLEDEVSSVPKLLATWQFDMNARDEDGQTLLARAIQTKDIYALNEVLTRKPNVDQVSKGLQPIHLAVSLDFGEAVHALINANADVTNPCLEQKETPLLLAAHYGKEQALEALLHHVESGIPSPLDTAVNVNKSRAIDLLCERLQNKKSPAKTLRCIAMLLCHGASAPRSDEFRKLLRDKNDELLDAVRKYAEKNPQLGLQFARAVQNKCNPLHDIIYATGTLTSSLRHFFCCPREVGYKVAELVSNGLSNDGGSSNLTDEQKYAYFVKRYEQEINKKGACGLRWYNPHSKMLGKLHLGVVNCWEHVRDYADQYPNSRTARIFNEIENKGIVEPVHKALDSSDEPVDADNKEKSSLVL